MRTPARTLTRTAAAVTVTGALGLGWALAEREMFRLRRVHVPVLPAIYTPVMAELRSMGLSFRELRSRPAPGAVEAPV